MGSKVGMALAFALGTLICYIALIGNGSKLLALFGAPAVAGSSGTSSTGTTAATAATPATNATNAGITPMSVSSSAVANPFLSALTLGGASLSTEGSAATSLLQSELGLSKLPATNNGSTAGTTGGLFGTGSSGSTPTIATQPNVAVSSLGAPNGYDYDG